MHECRCGARSRLKVAAVPPVTDGPGLHWGVMGPSKPIAELAKERDRLLLEMLRVVAGEALIA